MKVKLSQSGCEMYTSFGPHFKEYRKIYDEAKRLGCTVDWSKARGEVVGVDRRDGLVAVHWLPNGGVQAMHRSFVEFEEGDGTA